MALDVCEQEYFSVPVRDPVWKHVWLTPEFKDITRTEPFMRLYRIKQLGPSEYVYPGATHSRASHSIGVYHIALRILRTLLHKGADSWVTEEGCMSFLAAALLHDLGHFPFTHSLKELPLEDHETLSGRAVLEESLSKTIAASGANPEMTAAIIDKGMKLPHDSVEVGFFRNILSGVLDPDKLDYLNRDAYYCGVPYGVQDTDYILSQISPDKEKGITISKNAIMSVESILFSKYLMYRSVYWHKNIRISTAMMKKALYQALLEKIITPDQLYSVDDEGIYALLENKSFKNSHIPSDIRSRSFYHIILETPFNDRNIQLKKLEELHYRTEIENELSILISKILLVSVNANHVLIDIPERISFESDLYIHDEQKTFTTSSTVFSQDLVQGFTNVLRIVRIALHPSIQIPVSLESKLQDKLANYLGVGYNKD